MRKIDDRVDVPNRIVNPFLAQRRHLNGKRDPVIFDVGAHIGETTIAFRGTFPEATILSFEPCPESFRQLDQLVATDPGAEAFPLALSDQAGKLDFFLNESSYTHSLLPLSQHATTHMKQKSTGNAIVVDVTTVDDFCAQHSISKIDLLKTDAQGGDLQVLRGAGEMLRRKKIELVFSEVCIFSHYEGQASLDEMCRYMRTLDYQLCDMLDPFYSDKGELMWCDLLWRAG